MRRFLQDIELRMMDFPMNINNSSVCFLLPLLKLALLEKMLNEDTEWNNCSFATGQEDCFK